MKKRAVVMDSLADIPPYFETSLPVKVVHFRVYIDDKEYSDGETISKEDYYKLATKTMNLRTSYPPPEETLKIYKELEEEGVEEVLALHLPAKMSGFWQSFRKIMDKINMKVKAFDVRSVSVGSGMVNAKMIELFEKGASFEELEKKFWDIRKRMLLQFSVSSLKFLIKNGRIGKAKGLIGTLMNILPILTVDDEGEVSPLGKVRGRKRVIDKMVKNIIDFAGGRKIELVVGWGTDEMKERAMSIKEKVFEALGDKVVKSGEIRVSPTVASHTGPDVFGCGIYVL